MDYVFDETTALRELTKLLGPMPREWIDSLGMEKLSWNFPGFLIEPTGAPFSRRYRTAASHGGRLRSSSGVDNAPEWASLLLQIFVFEPSQRPSVFEILDHPWLKIS